MDPFAQQELEAEFWGRYDYMQEAFGAEARALREMAAIDAQYEAEQGWIEKQDDLEARGPQVSIRVGQGGYGWIDGDDDIPF